MMASLRLRDLRFGLCAVEPARRQARVPTVSRDLPQLRRKRKLMIPNFVAGFAHVLNFPHGSNSL